MEPLNHKERNTSCVLFVSRNGLFRQSLARVLTDEEASLAVIEAAGTEDAIEHIRASRPEITLLHMTNPVATSMHTLQRLHDAEPDMRIVVLLDSLDDALMMTAIQAGAAGCIDGSVDVGDLLQELHAAANGEMVISKGIARLIASIVVDGTRHPDMAHSLLEAPTPRERKILELLSLGLTNNAIARRLTVSESTVRAHVRTISQKLGTQNRVQAVAKAMSLGIIDTAEAPD
jgi:DNA-binding NarL/FixJ family response regulator